MDDSVSLIFEDDFRVDVNEQAEKRSAVHQMCDCSAFDLTAVHRRKRLDFIGNFLVTMRLVLIFYETLSMTKIFLDFSRNSAD